MIPAILLPRLGLLLLPAILAWGRGDLNITTYIRKRWPEPRISYAADINKLWRASRCCATGRSPWLPLLPASRGGQQTWKGRLVGILSRGSKEPVLLDGEGALNRGKIEWIDWKP